MRVFLPSLIPGLYIIRAYGWGVSLPLAFFWNDAIQSYLRSQKKPGKTHNVKFSLSWEEVEFHSFVPAVPPTPPQSPTPRRQSCTRTIDQVRSCAHTLREGKKLIRFPGLKRFLSVQLQGLFPPISYDVTKEYQTTSSLWWKRWSFREEGWEKASW